MIQNINWRRELDLFFTALTFLTRLPAPKWVAFEAVYLNESSRYFPLVGLLVGGVAAVTYIMLSLQLGALLAILLSVAMTVFITGAFHEDGFADMCDGFGGGWDKTQILTIMKDSRLGTYGALGLLLMIMTKCAALISLTLTEPLNIAFASGHFSWSVVVALLLAHPLSRLFAVAYIYRLDYVQESDQSKVKPLATKMTDRALLFAGASVIWLMLMLESATILVLSVVLFVAFAGFGRYLVSRIGGYTGDCLGAAQQLSEAIIYLVLCAMLSF